LSRAPADQVQLHGDETPKQLNYLEGPLPVIRAFRIGLVFPCPHSKNSRASYFLLDAAGRGEYGGTGRTFDWSIAQKAPPPTKIILAAASLLKLGEAILTVRPYAVDVASGVESRPGIKDADKLRESRPKRPRQPPLAAK